MVTKGTPKMKMVRRGESPLTNAYLKGVSCQVKLWGHKGTLGVILEKEREGVLILFFGEESIPPTRAQTLGASWDSPKEAASPGASFPLLGLMSLRKTGCKHLRQEHTILEPEKVQSERRKGICLGS